MKKILTINPGSTSTKLAFFEDDVEVRREELFIDAAAKNSDLMLDQLPARVKSVNDFLADNAIKISELALIVCRGGSMNGVKSGPYAVDEHVLVMS